MCSSLTHSIYSLLYCLDLTAAAYAGVFSIPQILKRLPLGGNEPTSHEDKFQRMPVMRSRTSSSLVLRRRRTKSGIPSAFLIALLLSSEDSGCRLSRYDKFRKAPHAFRHTSGLSLCEDKSIGGGNQLFRDSKRPLTFASLYILYHRIYNMRYVQNFGEPSIFTIKALKLLEQML